MPAVFDFARAGAVQTGFVLAVLLCRTLWSFFSAFIGMLALSGSVSLFHRLVLWCGAVVRCCGAKLPTVLLII